MYINRAIESTVSAISASFPVLLVTGPRQVGKTTLLQRLAEPSRRYVTLDDPLVRELAVSDPALFLDRFQPPLLIDEIQYAPALLPYIKMRSDSEKKAGDFWLTGSQMFHLMKNVSESLAGRVGIVSLLGLSQSEIDGVPSSPFVPSKPELESRLRRAKPRSLGETYDLIQRGSMPALHNPETAPEIELYYSSYLQTYLQRDIKDLTQVGDELAFVRFLRAVAARTGQVLQYTDLARDVGISAPTAKQWLSILIGSGIVVLIEPWYSNTLTRMIKAPKLYFLDTGLCAYLTRWTSSEALEAGAMAGAFFETFVVNEILKSWHNAGKRPPVFYYRDKEKNEIDIIIEVDGTLYPIEIKKSANPGKDAIKTFNTLAKDEKPLGTGAVVCFARDYLPIDPHNSMVPSWMV